MSSSARAERLSYQWIDRQDDLELLVDTLLACPRYALDTEFHRERTYFPKLALVQVAWLDESLGQQVALIDPLAVDVHALAPLLTSDVLCVIHAAQQDLDVLTHAAGAVPARMFDTQIAAGFVGYGTPSLVSLLQGEIGVSPAEGRSADRLAPPAAVRRPDAVRRRRRRVPARGARPAGGQARRVAAAPSGSTKPARNCARSR